MKNIIRLYSLLVGNIAPQDDEVWDLLISSIKIVEMVLSPSYTIGET